MSDPVVIAGRFRSGTSLVWSLFQRDPSCTAYYEPLHDNLLAQIGATQPTGAHRGFGDYWRAYRDIESDLRKFHDPSFATSRLILEPHDEHDSLENYLNVLIRDAAPRRAVLKITRADFRLGWLRRRLPEAVVLYVRRNNRDVWLSSRRHLRAAEIDDPNVPDAFELLQWSAALAGPFPFLWAEDIDSFTRHYYLWRLSDLAARSGVDMVLDFDEFVQSPDGVLKELVERGWLSSEAAAESLPHIDRDQASHWAEHAPESWFQEREQRAENELENLGLVAHFGRLPLADIRARHADAWGRLPPPPYPTIVALLLAHAADRRGEVTRLLGEVRRSEAGAD